MIYAYPADDKHLGYSRLGLMQILNEDSLHVFWDYLCAFLLIIEPG